MAAFNNNAENPAQPFVINRSQGPGTNTSFSTLFKDVGNIGLAAVSTLDQNNTEMIKEGAKTGVNDSLSDWNYRGDANSQAGTPSELQGYADKLAKTKQAYMSGSIKDSNFEIRIDSLSRRMRSQFPGYDDQVDQIINQTLNRSTANDLRKSLESEWNSENSKNNSTEATQGRMLDQYNKLGYMNKAFPNYYTNQASGKENPSFLEVQAGVEKYIVSDAVIKSKMSEFAFASQQGTVTDKQMLDMANIEASDKVKGVLATGLNGMKLQDIAGKFIGDATKWKPEEYQATLAALSTTKAKISLEIQNALTDPKYNKMSQAQIQATVSKATSTVDTVSEALLNKDTGALAQLKALQDATTAQDVTKFYDNKDSPEVNFTRSLNRSKTIFGEAATQTYINNSPEAQVSQAGAMTASMKGELSNGTALSKIITNGSESSSASVPPAAQKAVFDTATKLMLDPSVPQAGKEKAASSLFGVDNYDFLSKLNGTPKPGFQESERVQAYRQMTSPAVTAAIVKAAEQNPKILDNYKYFMVSSFRSLFSKDLENVQNMQTSSDSLRVTFDPSTMRFNASPTGNATPNSAIYTTLAIPYGMAQSATNKYGMQSIDTLNTYMANLVPAMKAINADPQKAMLELLTSNGALTAEKKGSLLYQAGQAVSNSITVDKTAPRSSNSLEQPTVQEKKPGSGSDIFGENDPNKKLRDFIGTAEGADYNTMQGGSKFPLDHMSFAQVKKVMDYNTTQVDSKGNKLSSASGKYQITKATLNRLQAKLGLSDDTLFTPEIQDKLANSLIEESGRNPDKLSGIWASLPRESGQSAYEGTGANHATVNRSDFLSALN